MHSDTIHFHCLPHRFMVGVWIAFEDVDEENGPLFIIQVHINFQFMTFDIGLNARTKQNLKDPSDNYKIYSKFLENSILSGDFERKYVTLKKGNVIIWAANLVHGGSQHKTLLELDILKSLTIFLKDACIMFQCTAYQTLENIILKK